MVYSMEGNHIILSVAENIAEVSDEKILDIKQQKRTINGTVLDEGGIPIIGANVIEVGTTNGSITDMDGKFTLQIGDNAEIKISYIGYLDELIEAQNRTTFEIRLREDTQALDELVVIGYGSMSRRDVTSSITTVQADKLNVGVYSDPAQLLQGKVPGLIVTQSSNPNGAPSITLRGASTFRDGAAQEPYYVIDGIPGMSLALVAPDDIESIEVLRDATATAIYGSKAANGVIIINTKKGRAGHTNINYSAYVATDNILKNWDVMDGDQLRRYASQNNITIINDLGANTDWQKEVQRTGLSHNHNVSISGGSEKSTFSSSINYMERQGVIKGTEMDRLIGRAFLEALGMNDRLTLSFNVNASITNRSNVPFDEQGQSVLDAMSYYSPLVPVKNEDGTWYENSGLSQNYNPVALINENIYNTESKQIQGNAKAAFKITDDLIFNTNLAFQNEQYIFSNYNTTQSLVAIGMSGKADRSTINNNKKVLESYFNYDRTFNDAHKLGLMAGYSWEESNDNDGFKLTTYNFYNDALTYHNLGMGNFVDVNGLGLGDAWMSSFLDTRETNVAVFVGNPSIEGVDGEEAAVAGSIPWATVLVVLYVAVVSVLLLRFLIQLASIYRIRSRSEKQIIAGVRVYHLKEDITPFSFFNWIFIHTEMHSEKELSQILLHERAHAKQRHSVDVVLAELLCLFFWWNPFLWLLKREITINLEYLADNGVLREGVNSREYQYHLLRLTYHESAVPIVNNFNVSQLKQRIMMMNRTKTPALRLVKYLAVSLTLYNGKQRVRGSERD